MNAPAFPTVPTLRLIRDAVSATRRPPVPAAPDNGSLDGHDFDA